MSVLLNTYLLYKRGIDLSIRAAAYLLAGLYLAAGICLIKMPSAFSFSEILAWIVYLITGVFIVWLLRLVHGGILDNTVNGPIVGFDKTGWHAYGGFKKFPSEHLYLIHALHLNRLNRPASEKLVQIGPDVLPALFYHCRMEGGVFRQAVVEIIDRIHPKGVVQACREYIQLLDPHSSWQICNVLRDLGPKAKLAIPELMEKFIHGDTLTSSTAEDALIAIGSACIEPIVQALLNQGMNDEFIERCFKIMNDVHEYEFANQAEKPMIKQKLYEVFTQRPELLKYSEILNFKVQGI